MQFQVDHDRGVVTAVVLEPEALQDAGGFVHIKAHFEGLIAITATYAIVRELRMAVIWRQANHVSRFQTLKIVEGIAHVVSRHDFPQPLQPPVAEFVSSFSYAAWTEAVSVIPFVLDITLLRHSFFQGNIYHLQTSEHSMATQLVWRNQQHSRYTDAAFVQPDAVVFAAVDSDARTLDIFDAASKERARAQLDAR